MPGLAKHEGVSCDACLKTNFKGRRYKCLVCYDYDLCCTCHEGNASSNRHSSDHPMQCILTPSEITDIYFRGGGDNPDAYTCPHCGKLGNTIAMLITHVSSDHTDATGEVLCPICASFGTEQNMMVPDFGSHLAEFHRETELITYTDDATARRITGATLMNTLTRSGVVRYNTRNVNASSLAERAPGSSTARSRRTLYTSGSLATALSSINAARSDGSDPLSEILSVYTTDDLAMQLGFGRHPSRNTRQIIERFTRRAQALGAAGPGAVGQPVSGARTAASNSLMSSVLASGQLLSSLRDRFNAQIASTPSTSQASSGIASRPTTSSNASAAASYARKICHASNSRFASNMATLGAEEQDLYEKEIADRMFFLQEVFLSMMGDDLTDFDEEALFTVPIQGDVEGNAIIPWAIIEGVTEHLNAQLSSLFAYKVNETSREEQASSKSENGVLAQPAPSVTSEGTNSGEATPNGTAVSAIANAAVADKHDQNQNEDMPMESDSADMEH